MDYTRAEILADCERALDRIATFYQQDFINYRGKTSDTGELYTEVVAEFVCGRIELFQNAIPQITRKASYKIPGHNGVCRADTNRIEEGIAMEMYRFCRDGGRYDHIGQILDYQTPLKSERSDTAGKIDLLAWDGEKLRILELKKPDSTETMLRCVLEGFTYFKTTDTHKLLQDFSLPVTAPIQACPFVFLGSEPYNEMQEPRPWLRKLMQCVNSEPYYIVSGHNGYIVTQAGAMDANIAALKRLIRQRWCWWFAMVAVVMLNLSFLVSSGNDGTASICIILLLTVVSIVGYLVCHARLNRVASEFAVQLCQQDGDEATAQEKLMEYGIPRRQAAQYSNASAVQPKTSSAAHAIQKPRKTACCPKCRSHRVAKLKSSMDDLPLFVIMGTAVAARISILIVLAFDALCALTFIAWVIARLTGNYTRTLVCRDCGNKFEYYV